MCKMTDSFCAFVIQISVFPSSQEGYSAWQVRNKKTGFDFLDLKYFAVTTTDVGRLIIECHKFPNHHFLQKC